MKDLLKKMAQVANELDLQGLEKEANKVTMSMLKVAQTVPSGMLQERMQQGQFKLQQSSLDEINKFISEHNLSREDAYSWITGKFGPRQANDWAAMTSGQPGAAGGQAGQAAGGAGGAAGATGAAGGVAGGQAGGAGAAGVAGGQAGGAAGVQAGGGQGGTITYDAARQRGLITEDGKSVTYSLVSPSFEEISQNIRTFMQFNKDRDRYDVAQNRNAILNITQLISNSSQILKSRPYLLQKEMTALNSMAMGIYKSLQDLVGSFGTQSYMGLSAQDVEYTREELDKARESVGVLVNQIVNCNIIMPPQGQATTPASSAKPLYGPPVSNPSGLGRPKDLTDFVNRNKIP